MFLDKILLCASCGKEFCWSAGEQEFYAQHALTNEPRHCKECREARKIAASKPREMSQAVCSACGRACQVPFQPTEGRPVYCSDCYARLKASAH